MFAIDIYIEGCGDEAMEAFFLAALQGASGIGCAQTEKLVQIFGSAAEVWQAKAAAIKHSGCLSERAAEALAAHIQRHPSLPEKIHEACAVQGISVCTLKDAVYPALLKEIFNPPQVLFYRGSIQTEACRIAVVGARHMSPYGRSAAEALSEALAAQGITVVSGAARGVDTAAHCGALQHGRTVAVLGCGIDVAYPPENRDLLAQIARNGVVISEYMPGTQPIPGFFPARNRIISGLARGTLVIEAAERSGSLITAELALSSGRDVFAVPGSIYSETSRGCHRLIQQGAKLVTCVEDILDEYGWHTAGKQKKQAAAVPELSEEEAAVYQVLSFDTPLSVDEIIYKLQGKNAANVAFLLLQMELKGSIRQDEAHSYIRVVR